MYTWLKKLLKWWLHDDNRYSPIYECPRCHKTLYGKGEENAFCDSCMIEWEVKVDDDDYYNQSKIYSLTGKSKYRPNV